MCRKLFKINQKLANCVGFIWLYNVAQILVPHGRIFSTQMLPAMPLYRFNIVTQKEPL